MLQILKMAFRDLGRNRRRSFFSALALAIGMALLLLIASVVAGEMRGALDTSIKLQTGHLQIQAKDYNSDKSSLAWKDLLENPAALAAQVATLAPVKAATPRLFASGIVSKGDDAIGVQILGIDPPSSANDPFREGLVSGQFLQADDREGVLIGATLADKTGLKTGDQISLLINTSNGEVDQQAFTVRGIYTTHTPAYDEFVVFMPLAKAQAITKTENHASAIFVLLKDKEQTGAVLSALQAGSFQVKTWQQMNEMVMTFEQFANSYMVLIYLIVLGITATVIINTLVMAVYERTREIGILAAIGMKGRTIMAMFFAESGFLAIGGILMGLALGGLLVAYAQKYGFFIGNVGATGIMLGERIYGAFVARDAINLTIVAFIVALLAALFPALMAARMEPVEALRGTK